MNERLIKDRLSELEIMSKVHNAMIDGQLLESILSTVTSSVKDLLSYDACNVYLLDEDRKCLRYISIAADMTAVNKVMDLIGIKLKELTISLREGTSFYDVVYNNRAIVTNDVRKAFEDYTDNTTLKKLSGMVASIFGFKSIARFPLFAGGSVIGVLGVGRRSEISESDVAQLKRIASAVSLTMMKSLTELQIRQKNEELMLLRRAIEVAPAGITMTDSEGIILFTNDAEAGMHGYTVHDLVGKNASIFNPAKMNTVKKRQDIKWQPWTREVVATRKDGTTFNQELTSTAVRSNTGDLIGVISVSKDITWRKTVERSMQLSAKFLQTTSESVVITDADANIVDVNESFVLKSGFTKNEVLGKNPRILKSGRHNREFYVEMWRSIIETGQWSGEIWDRKKSGEIYPKWLSISAVKDDAGIVSNYVGITTDLSQIKRSEEALRERRSQKEWRDTFDSITDMISIHDNNFTIIKANKAYAAYLGLTPQEVFQKKCHALFPHGASSPLLGCSPQRSADAAMPVLEEIVDANTQRTFNISTFPYYSPEGDIVGSIHIARDITERKEYEMQLIMNERLASLGEMATGIAHEINNPLESIIISAESLLLRVDKVPYDQAIFKKYLQIIDDEVLRCRDITGNMLSFFRKTSADRSTVDVHQAIDSALSLIGYQGRLKQVEVIKEYQGRPLIRGSEGELRQVIVALIINALDAMESKGTLKIETAIRADNAYVMISDTGPGISPENIAKIFSPFFTTKAETGGTGLGLSIARKIIASHQGSIDVASEQGHGAAFTIKLPLAPQLLP